MDDALPLPLPPSLDLTPVVRPPPPPLPMLRPARNGLGGIPLASMHDLSSVVRAVAAEPTFHAAVLLVQREACRLTRSTEALVVVVDWARQLIWTVQGRVTSEATKQLVSTVASSGHRSVLGNSLLEPLGNAPAQVVLALRRPSGLSFLPTEVAMTAALCGGFAPILERLLAA